jgi:hypothetical protein
MQKTTDIVLEDILNDPDNTINYHQMMLLVRPGNDYYIFTLGFTIWPLDSYTIRHLSGPALMTCESQDMSIYLIELGKEPGVSTFELTVGIHGRTIRLDICVVATDRQIEIRNYTKARMIE